MSANLVPTDETLCHYGAGKGYIPGISVSQNNFTDAVIPPTITSGNTVQMTNSASLIDTTDGTITGSNKRFRPLTMNATSTGFPTASNFDTTTLIVEQGVACNTSASSQSGQTGTNRSYNLIGSYNRGGSAPLDLILNSNYIKFGATDTYIGGGSTQEHVLVTTNSSRNNVNALGVRGTLIMAPPTSVQGDPYLRIVPSIPVSGSTPVGTVRDVQLNDPLQAGPFALPLSYLAPSGNTVLIRTNGLTNNRTLPLSEFGATITTAATANAATFSLAAPSFSTGVGANSFTLGSGFITLPSDSLGKTYAIDACVAFTIGAGTGGGNIELRGGVITVVGSSVLGTNSFLGLTSAPALGANVSIRTFYTSVVNREVIGLYNGTGQTATPVAVGKITIREVPRSDA
jgi:hypothetical protein